jgi:hypothetical protein
MAVRTDMVGIKRKVKVGVDAAQPSMGTGRSKKKTLPRDEAAALRRDLNRARATPGPAAKKAAPKRPATAPTTLKGRKKAPSQMNVKSAGGPKKRMPLHGG